MKGHQVSTLRAAPERLAPRPLVPFLALIVLAACSSPNPGAWPQLANRVGPYGGLLMPGDAAAAAADGFSLTVTTSSKPELIAALDGAGIHYLDGKFWNYIHARCKQQYASQTASGAALSCKLSDADNSVILSEVSARLELLKHDPSVVGYWVLDDYPFGDITPTLMAIRAMVQQANTETGFDRPLVCGIGGSLDHRNVPGGPIEADHRYTQEALINVSPAVCDIVAPYFYGEALANDPTWIDWSMQSLMPWFVAALQDRGFTEPVILPIVHAFSSPAVATLVYVEPTPADMAAQAGSYCAQGAISLLFFTWQSPELEQSFPGQVHTYVNDANLRVGVSAATEACRAAGVSLPTTLSAGG
jgi:hypothetical protein